MNPYVSLYNEKVKLNEASFNPTKIARILLLFNKILSKRIRQLVSGDPEAYTDYQNKEGKFHCFEYFYGKGKSIVYKINFKNSATFHSIDFYFKPYALEDGKKPSLVLDEIEGLNIVQLIDTVTKIVLSERSIEDVIFTESTKTNKKVLHEAQGITDLSFAENIRSMVGDFLLSLKGKDLKFALDTINKDDGKLYQKLHALYNVYRKKNKEKPDKYYTNFRATIKKQLVISGDRKGKIISAKVPKVTKQKYMVRVIEDDENVKEFRDSIKGTVKERFEEVEDTVQEVLDGQRNGFLLLGDPGIGKTWTVQQVLNDNGYSEYEGEDKIVWEEDEETGEQVPLMPQMDENQYYLLKGSVTPAALYSYMYMFNNGIILVDDTDSALKKDPNLIKAAIDTYPRRKISKGTKTAIINKGNDPFPPSFLYTGRIIFISNMYVNQIDSAIFSRGGVFELNLSSNEIVERAKGLIPKFVSKVGITKKECEETLDHVLKVNSTLRISKLDLRIFEMCLLKRKSKAKDWKNRIARLLDAVLRAGGKSS